MATFGAETEATVEVKGLAVEEIVGVFNLEIGPERETCPALKMNGAGEKSFVFRLTPQAGGFHSGTVAISVEGSFQARRRFSPGVFVSAVREGSP